jgi:hypothetical protein
VCRNFKKGTCRDGADCHFSHVLPTNSGGGGSQTAAAPAPPASGNKGKGKGEGKGKGRKSRSGTRPSSLTPAEKKLQPCFLYQRGACTKGDRCEYDHRMFTPEDIQKYGAPRSGAPSRGSSPSRRPRMPKRNEPCRQWAQTRTCSWGDGCAFAHDRPGAPAIVDGVRTD